MEKVWSCTKVTLPQFRGTTTSIWNKRNLVHFLNDYPSSIKRNLQSDHFVNQTLASTTSTSCLRLVFHFNL